MSNPLNITDYLHSTRFNKAGGLKSPSPKTGKAGTVDFESIFKALKTKEKESGASPAEETPTQRLSLKDYLLNTVPNQSLSALRRVRYGEVAAQSPIPVQASPGAGDEVSVASGIRGSDFTRAMKRVRGAGRSLDPVQRQKIDESIASASEKYDVPSDLIRAIIRAESGFRPNAVSSTGARGLMQLMPDTARDLGVRNSFDIEENIDGGVRYFRQMMDEFGGDVKLSLAAYNAGPGAVKRHDGVPPYRETQNYIRKVMRYSDSLV